MEVLAEFAITLCTTASNCNNITSCYIDSWHRKYDASYQSKKIFAQEDPTSFEICDNFVDDDGDGFMDAEDPESCSPATIKKELWHQNKPYHRANATTLEICDDFVDNDGDTLIDTDDFGDCPLSTGEEGLATEEGQEFVSPETAMTAK